MSALDEAIDSACDTWDSEDIEAACEELRMLRADLAASIEMVARMRPIVAAVHAWEAVDREDAASSFPAECAVIDAARTITPDMLVAP